MTGNYQAVFDAVQGIFSDAGREATVAAAEYQRPCVVFKPRLFPDGNQWCALLGDNLQEGVCGFGDSPAYAMNDFDANWRKPLPASQAPGAGGEG